MSTSEETVTIRPARHDELERVLALWQEGDAEPTSTDDVPALERLLAHDPGALLVADDGGRLVGSVVAGWDGWRGAMWRLVVAPAQRRRGIGRMLVGAAEERLRRLGARRLAVFTVSTEQAANAFWPAVGYCAQADRQRFVKNV